jgi:hypothetical protein
MLQAQFDATFMAVAIRMSPTRVGGEVVHGGLALIRSQVLYQLSYGRV